MDLNYCQNKKVKGEVLALQLKMQINSWETLGQTLSNETRDFTYSIMAISILKGSFTGRTKNDICGCQISHVPCPKSINIQKKLEVPPSLRIRVTFIFISHDNNSVALPLKYFKFWSKIDLCSLF